MPTPLHILFDLDGTLIDSAQAILASYRDAFAQCGVAPANAIDNDIVGPPLAETMRHLSGSDDPALIGRLIAAFKAGYDTVGYRQTLVYDGIQNMLEQLAAENRRLSIATNKRLHPTLLILEHLGWKDFFASVYALDLFEPRLPDKAAMIGRLLADQGIDPASAVYIGDRTEDGESAEANGLPFIAATWGYGSLTPQTVRPGWRIASNPVALLRLVLDK